MKNKICNYIFSLSSTIASCGIWIVLLKIIGINMNYFIFTIIFLVLGIISILV